MADYELTSVASGAALDTAIGLAQTALQADDIGVAGGAAAYSHTHSGTYEPADATILKSAAIGSTVQGYDADTAKLDVAQTWSAAQTLNGGVIITDEVRETPTVADTSTAYTVDITAGTLFDLTLTGNCTFTFPTATAGRQFTLLLKQDGTGSRLPTWPSSVRWPYGVAPTLTTTAAKTDVISFIADGTYWLGFVGGMQFTRS